MSAVNDPELVAREYADESRLSARIALQSTGTGPDPRQIAFEAVAEVSPRRILEVGPGRGELAGRMARELGARVVAVDQSPRMVELTRAQGVEAMVGDVEELPFADGTFDLVVAAWMLYHAANIDSTVRELTRVLRPEGRLVAVTNSERSLGELWDLLDTGGGPVSTFSTENGEWPLLRYFTVVERRDVKGTVTFPDRETARTYVASLETKAHLADRLPHANWPLTASRHATVFVCEL